MQSTIMKNARHNAARVLDGHKKTTFDRGLLWPLFGVEGPASVFCEGGESISLWCGSVNTAILLMSIRWTPLVGLNSGGLGRGGFNPLFLSENSPLNRCGFNGLFCA